LPIKYVGYREKNILGKEILNDMEYDLQSNTEYRSPLNNQNDIYR